MPHPPITLIAGPTASGKSRLALERARASGAAIVNADSQQLYADLRVLTARPSSDEERQAPHHLYGTVDAAEAWSVGRWTRAVLPLIDTLRSQGHPILIVGGTGLYFTALTKGLADIPEVPTEARDEAMALYDTEGEAAFRLRLIPLDPPAEAAIESGDRQRLTRAFAVARSTGRSLSDWQAGTTPLLQPGTYDRLVLEPERETLYAGCDARVLAMMQDGAVEEIRALIARDLDPALPAMKAVGVREIAAWLAGETTRADAVAALQQATRNYAKRQLTWFRNQCRDWARA
ncbi:tRNA (adenosine(37)-N6)-dimethylallyltransferase MiaA [Brevundimonas sp. TWP2-3-2]|uniref:tRNA (adenosine(37)-N6)-dimethylallyltransferase MiaA n=1 Tax=unclassified Brevundimonas TaxID=2622653 RepID=UPI003CE6FF32